MNERDDEWDGVMREVVRKTLEKLEALEERVEKLEKARQQIPELLRQLREEISHRRDSDRELLTSMRDFHQLLVAQQETAKEPKK